MLENDNTIVNELNLIYDNFQYQIIPIQTFNQNFPNCRNTDEMNKLFRSIYSKEKIKQNLYLWMLLLTEEHKLVGVIEMPLEYYEKVNITEFIRIPLLLNVSQISLVTNRMEFKEDWIASDSEIEKTLRIRKDLTSFNIWLFDHYIINPLHIYSMLDYKRMS